MVETSNFESEIKFISSSCSLEFDIELSYGYLAYDIKRLETCILF